MSKCKMVEFNTKPFVTSHLREPRGRGWWAFGRENVGKQDDVMYSATGTYTEAKHEVSKKAKSDGVCFLEVLP